MGSYRSGRALVSVAAVLVLALCFGAAAAEAAYPGRDGPVSFFAQGEGGRSGIFNIAPRTGRISHQPGTTGLDGAPLWSPDGRLLSFSRLTALPPSPDGDIRAETEVWVMGAGGGGVRRVSDVVADAPCTTTPSDTPSGWSPDGTAVFFVSTRWDGTGDARPARGQQDCPNGTLWSTSLTGGGEQVEIGGEQPGCTNIVAARWSPDASRIAFSSAQDDCNHLRLSISAADGTARRRLATGAGETWGVDWSPDGRRLVYENRQGRFTSLYVIAADGTGRHRIAAAPAAAPAWSPDGRWIAYVGYSRNRGEIICAVSPDGRRRRTLAAIEAGSRSLMNAHALSWRPMR